MASKTMTGPRAVVRVDGEIVGIFDSCSYSVTVGVEPIHILGRFSSSEIAVTSYEAVTVQCSGFRVIENGVHQLPKFPKVQDLLNFESVQIDIVDRAGASDGGEPILVVKNCVPQSHNGGYQAKATSRIQITYLGILAEDESGSQAEGGAVDLP